MIRRPPRSTRTDTLFPYTTLFRSNHAPVRNAAVPWRGALTDRPGANSNGGSLRTVQCPLSDWRGKVMNAFVMGIDFGSTTAKTVILDLDGGRSEERRGGKECVRSCRSWWSPDL